MIVKPGTERSFVVAPRCKSADGNGKRAARRSVFTVPNRTD
jgi:hypothetical protein